jgi:hypothetical protein
MVKCPPQNDKSKCVTKCYMAMVEDYVKMREQNDFFGEEKKDES